LRKENEEIEIKKEKLEAQEGLLEEYLSRREFEAENDRAVFLEEGRTILRKEQEAFRKDQDQLKADREQLDQREEILNKKEGLIKDLVSLVRPIITKMVSWAGVDFTQSLFANLKNVERHLEQLENEPKPNLDAEPDKPSF